MPLYPYRCTQCGYRFEKIQSFSSKPETACPQCKGTLERLLTAPGLQFKGAGWYVNDYTSKSSTTSNTSTESKTNAAATSDSNTAAPATKTESKPSTSSSSESGVPTGKAS